MAFDQIVLLGGVRTAFGDFGKSLRDVPLSALGAHVARASLQRSSIAPPDVDHLVFGLVGVVDHDGPFISRKVALDAGLPVESSALTVTRACGSGTQAIVSAAEQIATGHSRIALAAGGENFSRVPYVSRHLRYGAGRGPVEMEDGLDAIYRCPFSKALMGDTAEALAERFGYDRPAMDDWGFMSQQRAKAAMESGFLARQIEPIEVPDGRQGSRSFAIDEFPRPNVTREKLATLKPAFKANGTVTAGSSSGVTDGAAVSSSRSARRCRAASGRRRGWSTTRWPACRPRSWAPGRCRRSPSCCSATTWKWRTSITSRSTRPSRS